MTRTWHAKNQRPIIQIIQHQNIFFPPSWSNCMACPDNKSENTNSLSTQLKLKAPPVKEIDTSKVFIDELEVCFSKDYINTS